MLNYADAKRIACVTFAFNLDQYFHDVLVKNDDTLR